MKYKILPGFIAALMFSSFTFANEPVESRPPRRGYRTFDHWFASANAGIQSFVGDHDKQVGMGQRFTPNFGLSLGKWITGSFGTRVNINGLKIKGLTQDQNLATSKDMVIVSPHYLYEQEFNYIHAHIDALFHWSNDAYDVDLFRLYNIIPYAGIGIMSSINKQKVTRISPNLGFIQTLRLNDNWDFNLDIKGNVVGDKFDGERGGNKFEGRLSGTIGVTYNFR